MRDAAPVFLFFFVLYLIFAIKVFTFGSVYTSFFFGFYSMLITVYIISRFLLAQLHKPIRINPAYEPTISFVVPAKNEEDNIYKTIERFAHVEYPIDKVEVIAINDGSTDRTGEEMQRAARNIGPLVARIEVVDWKKNRGKRHGMSEGVKRARNDVIIFIDSDSFINPTAVRHLVKYFADPDIGAVSGHTDVENRGTNLLTEMQAIRYYIAFTIYKAAESAFGLVTCCPGCCSAYRRSYLLPFIDEWLEQTFLGAPCTFGDDRALTNFVLRRYRAVYSAEACATTVVPDKFRKYVIQQQRWKKSWIRETGIAATFMWRKHPLAALSFYSYMFLAFASPIVFFRAMLWHPIMDGILPVVYLTGLFLMLLLHGLYYRIHAGRRAWFLAITSFWINSIILIWQLPWAIITIRDSRWGTR